MHGKVVLYTTPMCGPCEQVKHYLQALGVEFTVIDVMMDEAAADLLASKGIRAAPALGVGEEIIAGPALDPAGIDGLLGL
jgi:glutaredoxin